MKTKILAIIALVAFSFSGSSQKKWSLQESVNYALENNISIKQSTLNIESIQEDVTAGKWSFYPSLNASTSANMNFGSLIDPVSNGRISSSTFSNSYGLSSGVTIFNGFRLLNSYKLTKLGIESSKLDLQKIKDDISLNVVNSYLNILFAKENLGVAKVQAEISKNQIDLIQKQVDAGTKVKGELLNVQSSYARDIQNITSLENTLNIALLQLAQVLQVDPTNFDVSIIEIDTPTASLMLNDPTEIYKKAVANRPEILKEKLNVSQSELNIAIAKSGFLPSVSASASAGSNYGHRFADLFAGSNDYFFKQLNDNFGYGFGVSVNIPIFNKYQTKASVNKSFINKERSELNLESAKLSLQQTIQRAFLDAKAALKSYEASKKSLEAQREAFKNAQDRYKFEAMTLFDFDQVRSRLVSAESELIRSKYDYVFKSKVLKFYNGESIID